MAVACKAVLSGPCGHTSCPFCGHTYRYCITRGTLEGEQWKVILIPLVVFVAGVVGVAWGQAGCCAPTCKGCKTGGGARGETGCCAGGLDGTIQDSGRLPGAGSESTRTSSRDSDTGPQVGAGITLYASLFMHGAVWTRLACLLASLLHHMCACRLLTSPLSWFRWGCHIISQQLAATACGKTCTELQAVRCAVLQGWLRCAPSVAGRLGCSCSVCAS
jgi:hypothetical protein